MTPRWSLPVLVIIALGAQAGLLGGCSESSLVPVPRPPRVLDDRMAVSGSFCTDPPQPAEFPVRVLFIVDVSQSMNVTDPAPMTCTMQACFTRRGQAVLDVMASNPAGNGVRYGLMTFASDSSILTKDAKGMDGFTDDGNSVRTKIPVLNNAGGETNYEGALANAYQLLQTDMIALGATERSRARYIVIFLSDGMPAPVSDNFNTPKRIRDRVTSIIKLQKDQRLAEVTFHSAYLAGPETPIAVQLAAKDLLETMSREGDGTFRTFQAEERIRFFYIDFSAFLKIFTLKSLVVSDDNSHPSMSPEGGAVAVVDSDGDGLLDDEEARIGADPTSPDSDGDGFNDQLEVRLRNAGFDPLHPGDADCADDARSADRLDDDGDGLRNCEERFLGTNPRLFDSDGDGLPDDVEFRMGSNPVVSDGLADPDFDQAHNDKEIKAHTDPQVNDVAEFSKIAYRYHIAVITGGANLQPGRSCFDFSVENITLAPTLAAGGLPRGTNTVMLRMMAAPMDSPGDYGTGRIACIRPRYRQDPEFKEPPTGHMTLPVSAFKKPAGPADDPEVFRADRDCVNP